MTAKPLTDEQIDSLCRKTRDVDALLQAAARLGMLRAAEIAAQHECGGDDDFTCHHQNCAFYIEGAIIREAAVAPTPTPAA